MTRLAAALAAAVALPAAGAVYRCDGPRGTHFQPTHCAADERESPVALSPIAPPVQGIQPAPEAPCAVKPVTAKEGPVALKFAHDAIRRRLKDPDSARYTDERVAKSTCELGDVYTVCGDVNARNSFGGYVGARRYLATLDVFRNEATVWMAGGDDPGDLNTLLACLRTSTYP